MALVQIRTTTLRHTSPPRGAVLRPTVLRPTVLLVSARRPVSGQRWAAPIFSRTARVSRSRVAVATLKPCRAPHTKRHSMLDAHSRRQRPFMRRIRGPNEKGRFRMTSPVLPWMWLLHCPIPGESLDNQPLTGRCQNAAAMGGGRCGQTKSGQEHKTDPKRNGACHRCGRESLSPAAVGDSRPSPRPQHAPRVLFCGASGPPLAQRHRKGPPLSDDALKVFKLCHRSDPDAFGSFLRCFRPGGLSERADSMVPTGSTKFGACSAGGRCRTQFGRRRTMLSGFDDNSSVLANNFGPLEPVGGSTVRASATETPKEAAATREFPRGSMIMFARRGGNNRRQQFQAAPGNAFPYAHCQGPLSTDSHVAKARPPEAGNGRGAPPQYPPRARGCSGAPSSAPECKAPHCAKPPPMGHTPVGTQG